MPPLSEFLTFAAVGVLAQLVDGALGMAYGVVSAAMLLGLGLPPAVASASVHYAETFTCGASGLSHLVAGNVRRLILPTPRGLIRMSAPRVQYSKFNFVCARCFGTDAPEM